MRRDMDLIRDILLAMEPWPLDTPHEQVHIEGRTEEEIIFHVLLMKEAGLIQAMDYSDMDGTNWIPRRITYEGYEFLEAARTEDRWSKAKDALLKGGGALTLEALKLTLSHYAKTFSS